MPLSDVDDDEINRLYGRWADQTPADALALFDGYTGPWWISGGWAIEAFTGVSRPHGDMDVSVPRAHLAAMRRHLAGRVDLWAADQEVLRVLLPVDIGREDHHLPETCENVRARLGGTSSVSSLISGGLGVCWVWWASSPSARRNRVDDGEDEVASGRVECGGS